MAYQFKYGLKNAHIFLNQLKNRPSSPYQQQQENTFVEQSSHDHEDVQTSSCTLANMVILQHLKYSMKLYKQDLETMLNNRDNYTESIELLIQKIRNLTEMKTKNQQLSIENQELNNILLSKVQQYHDKCKELNSLQMRVNGQIAKTNNKVKVILEYLQQDSFYDGYVNQWLQYLKYQQIQRKKIISARYDEKKIIGNLLGEKKQTEQESKLNSQVPFKKQAQKQDGTRMSLVSNLKQFSKNFRVPK